MLRNPSHRRPELPPKHQAIVCMFLALHRLFPPGDGELLNARAQGVLDKHPMLAVPPSVQALLYPPSDGVGCGDMLGLFQYHRLKNDEPLKVPLSVLHPLSSSPSIPTNLIPTFLLGASYRLNGMTMRSRHHTCHAASLPMPPSKWVIGLA